MFVHAEIDPRTMGWENFMTEMAETFGKSHGNNRWRCGSRPMETDDGTEWNRSVNLKRFPTKPEDLHVKLDGNKLVLSGNNAHMSADDPLMIQFLNFKIFLNIFNLRKERS